MKLSMSNLDIMVCVRGLKNYVGAHVDQIYEVGKLFLIKLRLPKRGKFTLLVEPGRRLHLTKLTYETPKRPGGYSMLLRKYLSGSRLVGVEQLDFERVVSLKFSGREECTLVIELFGRGNLILCNSTLRIIQPYRAEVWRYRVLKPGEKYTPPPAKAPDITQLTAQALGEFLKKEPTLAQGLAKIGGSVFADEACLQAKVSKSLEPARLSNAQLETILGAIEGLLKRDVEPRIVYEGKSPVDVVPFPLLVYRESAVKKFRSFDEALDEYFNQLAVSSALEEEREQFEEELGKLQRRLEEQSLKFANFYAEASSSKQAADVISIHHLEVGEAISNLRKIQHAGNQEKAMEILEEAKKAGQPWAKFVEAVNVEKGEAVLSLAGRSFPVDIRMSAFENMSRLYELHKKLVERAAGAKDAMEHTRKEIEELQASGPRPLKVPVPRRKRKEEWFERYRWFISSEGFMVLGGRDVATNEEVVSKHMASEDLYLHADMVGAPHVVIKTEGKKVSEKTIQEAAIFAATNSRAWGKGLGSVGVYWAFPKQVSKRAPSGMSVSKGAYLIRGKKNLLKVPLEAAVGVVEVHGKRLVSCGPPSAIQARSPLSIKITQGNRAKLELAKELQVRLRKKDVEVSIDELMRALPPGKGKIEGPRGAGRSKVK